MKQRRAEIIIATIAVVLFVGIISAALMMQKVCVNYIAPWVLDTQNKRAIALYCTKY